MHCWFPNYSCSMLGKKGSITCSRFSKTTSFVRASGEMNLILIKYIFSNVQWWVYKFIIWCDEWRTMSFPHSSVGKESACNAGDLGLICELGRSSGEGKGYPLQDSGLENSMACIAHAVTKSLTWLSDFHFLCCYFSSIKAADCASGETLLTWCCIYLFPGCPTELWAGCLGIPIA